MPRRLRLFLLLAVIVALAASAWLLLRTTPTTLRITERATQTIHPSHAPARLTVKSDGQSTARLVVWTWGGRSVGWRMTVRTNPIKLKDGTNTIEWKGHNSAGSEVRDRSYVAAVCSAPRWSWVTTARRKLGLASVTDSKAVRTKQQDSDEMSDPEELKHAERSAKHPPWKEDERCTEPVVVQVNRLSIATPGWSVVPGGKVPVAIAGTYDRVSLVKNGREHQPPLATWTHVNPTLAIPSSLTTGLYHLVATAGEIERTVPLIVRRPDSDLTEPPAQHTALVVWGSLTWQAYSTFDGDDDGKPDSWYQLWSQRHAPLDQALQPPGWEHGHDAARHFSQWLWNRPAFRVQTIADRDLESMPQAVLNQYEAVILPSHTEYFTRGMYDRMFEYIRSGGDVVNLNANSFYREVELHRDSMELVNTKGTCPRCFTTIDGERSDHALLKLGYSGCCEDDLVPYEVTADAPEWLLKGTGLRPGDRFGRSGTEVDAAEKGMTIAAQAHVDTVRGRVGVAMVAGPLDKGEIFAGGSYEFLNMSDKVGDTPMLSIMLDNIWNHMVEDK